MIFRGPGRSTRPSAPLTAGNTGLAAIVQRLGPDTEGDIEDLPRDTLNEYLPPPGSSDRRIFELASHVLAVGSNPLERARAIEKYLRNASATRRNSPGNTPKTRWRTSSSCREATANISHLPWRMLRHPCSIPRGHRVSKRCIQSDDRLARHSRIRCAQLGRSANSGLRLDHLRSHVPQPAGRGFGAIWSQAMLHFDAAETLSAAAGGRLQPRAATRTRGARRAAHPQAELRWTLRIRQLLLDAAKVWAGYFTAALAMMFFCSGQPLACGAWSSRRWHDVAPESREARSCPPTPRFIPPHARYAAAARC